MKTTSTATYFRPRAAAVGSLLSILFLTAPIVAFAAPRPTPSAAPASEQKLDLSVAAAVIQHAIAKYQSNSSPKLESADLAFKVTSGNTLGVGFSFWIITIGASRTESEVQTVAFNYKVPDSNKPGQSATPAGTSPTPTPPGVTTQINREFLDMKTLENLDIKAFAEKDVNLLAESIATRSGYRAPNVKKFEESLTKAIDGAAKAAQETPKIGGAEFQTFAVTIDYSVKFEGSGSASIPVFQVLTIGPKGSVSRDSAHSLKLTFRK